MGRTIHCGAQRHLFFGWDELELFSDRRAAREFVDGLWTDPLAEEELRQLAAEYAGSRVGFGQEDDAVKDVLADLLVTGELKVVRPTITGVDSLPRDEDEREDDPVLGETAAKKRTWIEVELVDERGRPVAGERWSLTLPDGTTRSGTTDDKGVARVEGIDPGTCWVSFPDLNRDAWERI